MPTPYPSQHPLKGVLYANHQLQPLAPHLFAVGLVAQHLYFSLFNKQNNLAFAVFLTGCLHSIGKADPKYQKWLRKECKTPTGKTGPAKHPNYNEVSAVLYQLLDRRELRGVNSHNKAALKQALLWQSTAPSVTDQGCRTYQDIKALFDVKSNAAALDITLAAAHLVLADIEAIAQKYGNTLDLLNVVAPPSMSGVATDESALLAEALPKFKDYSEQERLPLYRQDVGSNSTGNIIRACLATATQLVSHLSAAELAERIDSKTLGDLCTVSAGRPSPLPTQLGLCLSRWAAETTGHAQRELNRSVAKQLLLRGAPVGVLAGAAEVSKTRAVIEWAHLKEARRIIWVCPRVQVCQNIFEELIALRVLPQAKVEIFTGELKYTNRWDAPTSIENHFSGDIVITTVDQLLKASTAQGSASLFVDYLDAHVIFDE